MADVVAVAAEVDRHLPRVLGGALVDVVADTGGWGLCRDVSRSLLCLVGRGHLLYLDFRHRYAIRESRTRSYASMGQSLPLPAWASVYGPAPGDTGHVVAVIDGVVVDLTARQFRAELPFPLLLDPEFTDV